MRIQVISNGLILGGQDLSRRQTVFFLSIDPRDESHKDPECIDFSVPRRARYVHSAWKKHEDAICWFDIDLAIKEGLTFYQTRSNAIILKGTLPAYCIPKVVRLKTGEVLYEKSYMSPRPPPKISLRHGHNCIRGNDELDSTVEQQTIGKLVQQSCDEVQHAKFSKSIQSKPKPICDRSEKPEDTERVLMDKGKTSRSHEIDEKRLHKELNSSDGSEKSERLSEDIRVKHSHDGTGQPVEQNSPSAHTVKEKFTPEENRDIVSFNADNEFNRAIDEENIDFNIPGVPNSTVKRSHDVNVQNFIQKIENHPQRHALQRDLQQHRQFNRFSKESRDVIKAAGNTELCELLDVEPKAQCKVCLSYWDVDIVYWRSAWRTSVTTEGEGFCMPIKGKSETAKKRTCWLFTEHHSDERKEVDWYWTRETFSLYVRGIEESDSSSSSFSACTSKRGWSSSLLVNKGKFPESIPTVYSSDWRSWTAHLTAGGETKRRFHTALMIQE